MFMRRVLSFALVFGSLGAVGCSTGGAEEELESGFATRDPAAIPSTPEEEASAAAEPTCAAQHFDYQLTGDSELDADGVSIVREEAGGAEELGDRAEVQACGSDYYFHPSNGMHGGYVNAWRLCNEGWDAGRGMWRMRICRGGYSPIRYWNPESCNGTVHNYYPQGWSGYSISGGGCC
jgi:hypothetical protein